MTAPLHVSASATIDATGTATVTLGPVPAWRRWQVTHLAVTVAAGTRPQFRLYRNDVAANTFLDGTLNGATNASETDIGLAAGEYLTGQWVGGTPGQVATLTAEGHITEGW